MSGDKVSKTDKAAEIWYRLLLDEVFKQDLEQLRKHKNEPAYYFGQQILFEKYRVLPTQRLLNICDQYIFSKKYTKVLGNHLPARLQTPSEDELKKSKRAFVKLWIYDGVTREEILDYIKKNWKKIGIILKVQDLPKIKRVRRVENKKLIELVLKLNKLPTGELRRLTGENNRKGVYRENLIKHLVKKENYSTSFETIKGIVTRFKKNT